MSFFVLLFFQCLVTASAIDSNTVRSNYPNKTFVVDEFLLQMWQYQSQIRWIHGIDHSIDLDKRLSENAAQWANHLLKTVPTTASSSLDDPQLKSEFVQRAGRQYSENIIVFNQNSKPPANLALAVLFGTGPPPGWYNTITDGSFNYAKGTTPSDIVKILWKATDYFGCGVASSANTIIVVCHYVPLENYNLAADRLMNLRKPIPGRERKDFPFRNLTDKEMYSISRSKHMLVVFQEGILQFLESMEYQRPSNFIDYWVQSAFRKLDPDQHAPPKDNTTNRNLKLKLKPSSYLPGTNPDEIRNLTGNLTSSDKHATNNPARAEASFDHGGNYDYQDDYH